MAWRPYLLLSLALATALLQPVLGCLHLFEHLAEDLAQHDERTGLLVAGGAAVLTATSLDGDECPICQALASASTFATPPGLGAQAPAAAPRARPLAPSPSPQAPLPAKSGHLARGPPVAI